MNSLIFERLESMRCESEPSSFMMAALFDLHCESAWWFLHRVWRRVTRLSGW